MNGTEGLDTIEIQQLLARYSRSLDTRDWELYRSVFTEDAYIDYAASGGLTGRRDDVVEWLIKTLGTFEWSGMHYITNIEAEVRGRQRPGTGGGVQPDAVPRHEGADLLRRLLPPRHDPHPGRLAQPQATRGSALVPQRTPRAPMRAAKRKRGQILADEM